MIIAVAKMGFRPKDREEAVKILRSVLGPTQYASGCISCGLYEEVVDQNVIVIIQEWASQEDLDKYLRSEEYKRILAAMDMGSAPPEVKFIDVAHTGGLEMVEAARGIRKPRAGLRIYAPVERVQD
jgi:quinol monooxygenase YgiN